MVLQSRYWCFTLNNYTDIDTVNLHAFENNTDVAYIIFGKEVGESGTPHYQGFIRFEKKKRLNGVKRLIGEAHVEVARNPTAAIAYCKKDGDYTEYGTIESKQGERNDLNKIKEDVLDGNYDLKYYCENHSEIYASKKQFIQDYIKYNRVTKKLKAQPLRKWQAKLWNYLKLEPDSREILFFVDRAGNTGKTWFARYYCELHEGTSQTLLSGKLSDLALAYDENNRVLFVDVPRARLEYFSYEFLEYVKNGLLFSGKYNSTTKKFDCPHIVVFMNEPPLEGKLSQDRYNVTFITKDDCIVEADEIVPGVVIAETVQI